jgi:hypothetical protein
MPESSNTIAWAEKPAALPLPAPLSVPGPAPQAAPVAAAKLQVLQLDAIQQRLGLRWPLLSPLVHKLFERALLDVQGPGDHFLRQSELCYVATFRGMTADEAALAAAAVAQEVCDLLFNEDHERIAMRCLVGLSSGAISATASGMAAIGLSLERSGVQSVIARSPGDDAMAAAHAFARRLRQTLLLSPAWDLQKCKSQWLLLGLKATAPDSPAVTGVRRALGPVADVAELEIALLRAACEYGVRLEQAGQMGAVTVGVSYESVQSLAGRTRYLKALRALTLPQSCPLMVKIDAIPAGAPLNRLAEIIAMLGVPGVRLLVKFEDARRLPHLDMRLGMAGLGGLLPQGCAPDEARLLAARLGARAQEQRAFGFLEGVETPKQADAVMASGIRFATGSGFGPGPRLGGLEALPHLPLDMPECWFV